MATTSRRTTRRGQASTYAPLHDRATFLSNEMWERAVKIADIMAPAEPTDQEEIEPREMWMLLETVASNLSPSAWDAPEAIDDLYKLRKQFMPDRDHEALKDYARDAARLKKMLPDPMVSPASPEFETHQRRLKE